MPSTSFDVIGTCFHFDRPIAVIQSRLSPPDAKSLFFSWFYAAQRDFTYLSLCQSYKPIASVLSSTFRRACMTVGVDGARVTDDVVADVMSAFKSMEPREGLKNCFDGLREIGFDVYAVTNGSIPVSLAYYHNSGIELAEDHLLSCDTIKTAKPDPKVYSTASAHLDKMSALDDNGQRWFVAAHAWDLIAASKAGFKTAYLDFEEHDPCTSIFGEFDLYAKNMEDLLEKLKNVVLTG
ncbi:HAD-like domain-containing protein [Ampelomyces quisqualis]|uniref:HAD-like domain-containing protein n=1 Tax=Ampelomyces quisqualis TaxID=50730 RepID=A0A6A5QE65_AMPQU|nr:HAD-like domain-containing protein [Ampelomyces quisqualis]